MFVYLVDGNCTIMNFRSVVFRLAILVMMGLCSIVATPSVGQYSDLRDRALDGDADAQFRLGEYYYYGEKADQDYEEGLKWFRLSAEQGYAAAQADLGLAHYFGTGVEQNYSEAVRLFRLAATQGHVMGQIGLAIAYHTGSGVEADNIMAYMWSTLGNANVRKRTSMRTFAFEMLEYIGSLMTSAEIEQATSMAQACADSNYSDC